MTTRLCFMLTWNFHLNKANWFIRQAMLWSRVKVLNLNTVLAFGSLGHILIWLGKVTVQNSLCHLEYKIFTFHTLWKLSAVDLCLVKNLCLFCKSPLLLFGLFFVSFMPTWSVHWWNWENLVEFKVPPKHY